MTSTGGPTKPAGDIGKSGTSGHVVERGRNKLIDAESPRTRTETKCPSTTSNPGSKVTLNCAHRWMRDGASAGGAD